MFLNFTSAQFWNLHILGACIMKIYRFYRSTRPCIAPCGCMNIHRQPSKHTTSQGRLQYVWNWSVRRVLNETSPQRLSDVVPTTSHTDVLTTSIGRCVFLRDIHLNRSKGLTYEMADIFNIWNYLNTPSICLNLDGPSGIKWDIFTTSQRRRTHNVSRRRLNDVDRTLCVLHHIHVNWRL